jgi:hypothetical protein
MHRPPYAMHEENESRRRGLTRVHAVRKPNVRDADYRVDDGIMAVLRVTVLGGMNGRHHGGVLRLRLGENVASVDPDDDGTVSFPVHRTPTIVAETPIAAVEDGPSSHDVDDAAPAALMIQTMWRRKSRAVPPHWTSSECNILIVEATDDHSRIIGRGYIPYRDLLGERGGVRTTVRLIAVGLGRTFRNNVTLNLECRLEDFHPGDGPFSLPTLRLHNNLNKKGGMMRTIKDGGTFEPFPTWQMRLWEVTRTFSGEYSRWNEEYHSAQQIYGSGLQAVAIREGIRLQHSMLYSKNKSVFGTSKTHLIRGVSSFIAALPTSSENSTPGMSLRFTYVILTNSNMHFSITGKKTAQDFLSKHALHNNAGVEVAFAGEFFFDRNSERALATGIPAWIIDNNSGTFAPAKEKLHLLQALLEFNFGKECPILALDRCDPALSEYFNVNHVE